MTQVFDSKTISQLATEEEVQIVTRPWEKATKDRTTIWVAVVDGKVFVRSFRGPNGRWYRTILVHPDGELEVAGKKIRVKAVPVSERTINERVSQAYLEKYRASPYAKDMVRPEVLPTTLRLDPA